MSLINPSIHLLQYVTSLQPEMLLNNVFEAWHRVTHVIEHRPVDSARVQVMVIRIRSCGSVGRSSEALTSRLVEERIVDQNQRLNRHKNLQKAARIRPLLFWPSAPCVQQREANLSAIVEVRIEANAETTSCFQVHERWIVRVFGWKVDIENEASVLVWRASWTGNEEFHDVQTIGISSHEDGAAERQWQRV